MSWDEFYPRAVPLERDVPPHFREDPRGKFLSYVLGVAYPSTIDHLKALVAFARKSKVPLVPYGGGTGLVGGQVYPHEAGALLISFRGFRDIEIEGDSVVVGTGVVLDELQTELAKIGKRVPLALASSGSAQIGGLVSTNAGGIETLRFGNMREQVRGVLAVAGDGTVIDKMSSIRKDNTGFDLARLLVGSEGSLALLAKVRLRIVPCDKTQLTVVANLPALDMALPLLALLRTQFQNELAAFELLSGTGLQMRHEHGFLPEYPLEISEWAVLFELASPRKEGPALLDELISCLEVFPKLSPIVAKNARERDDLWKIRETLPLANRKTGAIASHDISITEAHIEQFLVEMPCRLRQMAPDIRIHAFGHLGDGNLHFNLFPARGKTRDDYKDIAEELSDDIYRQVRKLGGSISAEHGIGRAKTDSLIQYGYGDVLHIMRAVKAAFDPDNILNPGVIISETLETKA